MRSLDFPWRVAIDWGASFELFHDDGNRVDATYSGEQGARPVVGDRVRIDGFGRITQAAPRRSWIARARADGGEQLVAANVTAGFVVTSPEPREFSPRRVVRYLLALRAGNVEPVILLNKSDACHDLDARVAALRAIAGGAAVLPVSARDGWNCAALDAYLEPGATVALCGSSGVGKSTLVNRLAGEDVMSTAEMREDGRGRHTTTVRRLIVLANGAALVDTPGMRAFAPAASPAQLDDAFADIAALAAQCRFRDCGHDREPGCAVREGAPEDRLGQWQQLRRELEWRKTLVDARAASERKNRWKAIHKAMRKIH
ncbi:MAG: ribosome small subunit-dependent GTPase A [Candidatus Eremiobacteraeota bacterium]|nr:ribosome small subunit-dependent GTPase A [Candidatus Eremiobacteraeota bacterium]